MTTTSSSEPASLVGEVFGNYRLVSRIGAGGMGSIWLGEHQLLGSRAAIKILHPEMSANRRVVQRFFDEARAATRIQDPGIVTILDFGWREAMAFLVMEFLVGETVAERICRETRLPPLQALRITQHTAIAMAAAHAVGIIHRDLKPDNLYLVADPAMPGGERTKILDFGIAKLIDDADANRSATKTDVIMGTPAFMSPEQCRGAGHVDYRTDIYALGCVLFNTVCGRPPFIAGTAGDLIVAHISEQPVRPSALVPGLPPELDALVLRCLEKDPANRFASMTELVRAAGAITSDNVAISTIHPKQATTGGRREAVEARVTLPSDPGGPSTTLEGSSGETAGARPPRSGLVLGLGAAVVVAVIAVVAVLAGSKDRAASTSGAPAASVLDAAPDESVDAREPLDASSSAVPSLPGSAGSGATGSADHRGPASSKRRRPTGSATAAPAGSATAAPAGSGSADPYSDR